MILIDINDLVEEYNDNIYDFNLHLSVKKNKRKWIVEFPYEIIYNYMKTQANINDINSKYEIKALIFVGNYSSNGILLRLIKKGLNKITTYLRPSNQGLAIMEGGVLYGIEPSTIKVKKTKNTKVESVNNESIDK